MISSAVSDSALSALPFSNPVLLVLFFMFFFFFPPSGSTAVTQTRGRRKELPSALSGNAPRHFEGVSRVILSILESRFCHQAAWGGFSHAASGVESCSYSLIRFTHINFSQWQVFMTLWAFLFRFFFVLCSCALVYCSSAVFCNLGARERTKKVDIISGFKPTRSRLLTRVAGVCCSLWRKMEG